jgi:hypothetical protein
VSELVNLEHATSSNITVALLAFGSTTLAGAQTGPSNKGATVPDTQSTDANVNGSVTSETPAGNNAPADKMSAQDPKVKQCVKSERAKNSGQSDSQIKQKCMLQVGSHQGE